MGSPVPAMVSSGETALAATALTVSYGRHRGIVEVDLQVPRGEVVGLVGANGAGKTTLMRTVLDFLRPTSGSLSVLGRSAVLDSVAVRRRVSYLPGELVLPPRLTGHAAVRRFMFARRDVPATRVNEVAERLHLDLSRRVNELSKGNKQKLGLLLALAPPVELLVLDEPTSGLDPLLQREFAAMVRERTQEGATVLLSSHVMSEVEHIATRVALMRDGRLTAYDDIAAVLSRALRRGRARLSDVSDTSQLADALRRVPGVSEVETVATTAQDQGHVAFGCSGPVDAVVKALARFELASLDLAHGDLEDAFFSSAET